MSTPTNRIQSLDVLRGIAVGLVLIHHTLAIDHMVVGYHWWLTLKIRQLGWSGVDLFFVLSGFLVGGLLCAEYRRQTTVNAGRFLVRRAFKIYPAFYVLLTCTLVYELLKGATLDTRAWLGELFFLQNYVGRVWKQTWSLAVEEHFYLLIALTFWIAAKLSWLGRPRIVVSIATAVLLGVLGYRCWLAANFPFNRETHMFATHVRIDSLLFGVMLAYAWHFYHEWTRAVVRRGRWLILLLSIACLAPLLQYTHKHFFMYSVGFTLNYLGYGGLLLLGVCEAWKLPSLYLQPAVNLIAAIGRQSYSIYLWHMAVFYSVDWLLPQKLPFEQRFFLHAATYITLAIVLGSALGLLIEVPALKLRERLFPARTS